MPDMFDLPPDTDNLFPAHGWVRTRGGLRHLRLPIMRLFRFGQPTHEIFRERRLAGMWLQSRDPNRGLRRLAVGLRDLHAEIRTLHIILNDEWHEGEPSKERNDYLNRLYEGYQRIDFMLFGVLVLLRRLADDLINASRPLLFKDWKSAPEKLKVARSKVGDESLLRLNPICKVEILRDALINHTAWFDKLRSKDNTNKGVRDILVHADHILQIGGGGSNGPGDAQIRWQVNARLLRDVDAKSIDLFETLIECITGACRFMERLYCCVGPRDGYHRDDVLFLTGCDNDAVGFWPPILGQRSGFPLV